MSMRWLTAGMSRRSCENRCVPSSMRLPTVTLVLASVLRGRTSREEMLTVAAGTTCCWLARPSMKRLGVRFEIETASRDDCLRAVDTWADRLVATTHERV